MTVMPTVSQMSVTLTLIQMASLMPVTMTMTTMVFLMNVMPALEGFPHIQVPSIGILMSEGMGIGTQLLRA